MATTIARTTFTDDNGDGISGDAWGSTLINSSIYDPIDDLFAGQLTLGAGLHLDGAGPHSVGAPANLTRGLVTIGGSHTTTGSTLSAALLLETDITVPANAYAGTLMVGGTTAATLIEAASGTHPVFAGIYVNPPTITGGAAALTASATIYVKSAPTGGTSNYALFIDAGTVRWDDGAAISGAGGAPTLAANVAGGTGPQNNAQAQWLHVDIAGTSHWIPVWT